MATATRSTAKSPDVDVVAENRISRLEPGVTIVFQPAFKVMEADGTTQATNALGQPDHAPANVNPYTITVRSHTQAGVDRLVALELGALTRIVAATLSAVGDASDPLTVAQGLLQAGQGVDSALTAESEALLADLRTRWDALTADPEMRDPFGQLETEFSVQIGQMEDGPFR